MSIQNILSDLASHRNALESLYKHFHRHPELSQQEYATADRIEQELRGRGIEEVLRIGKTGLVAILRNGDGPVVAMRGDIDALPMAERSGVDYAAEGVTQVDESTGQDTPVAHSCGHDMHIVCLLGATWALHAQRDAWSGTFLAVFQPGEENAAGAKAMVAAGIVDLVPKPDVYLGQHVLGSLPGGTVGIRSGPLFSAAASIEILLHGRGSHGSMPNLGVDPIVLGAAIVGRLQSIVSREVSPRETAVVTVGSFHAGTKSNIIPDSAVLQLNTRAFDKEVEKHLHEAIERIVRAECEAARSPKPPEFRYYDQYPLTSNHEEPTAKVRAAFDAYFGDLSLEMSPVPASEDFSVIPDAFGCPYAYWGLGGFADWKNAPGNHSPLFAPDIHPTLERGIEAIVVAASPWLIGSK